MCREMTGAGEGLSLTLCDYDETAGSARAARGLAPTVCAVCARAERASAAAVPAAPVRGKVVLGLARAPIASVSGCACNSGAAIRHSSLRSLPRFSGLPENVEVSRKVRRRRDLVPPARRRLGASPSD
jgi:hypothetical protein